MAELTSNSYGKERVRLTKVVRTQSGDGGPPVHHVYEYTVHIMLYGDFDRVYTHDDNGPCVPTDTMRNTVYAIARQNSFSSPEEFGELVTARFIKRFDHIYAVDVDIAAQRWKRIDIDGAPHPHAFEKEHGERTAKVERRREGSGSEVSVSGGVSGMEIFKSSGSGFSGFYKDEYTTLPETDDRILASTVDASWRYLPGTDSAATDVGGAWDTIHDTIARVFAEHDSPSLQATLWEMGKAVLAAVPAVESISFSMPNQHHILFDLDKLGMDNPNEIFYGTDSPFGIITGTVSREGAA